MNKLLLALALCAMPVMAASASDLRMTVEQPHFTCEGHDSHFVRAAYHPQAVSDDAPLPCCDGKLGCAQFLSTNTVVRQSHEWHG